MEGEASIERSREIHLALCLNPGNAALVIQLDVQDVRPAADLTVFGVGLTAASRRVHACVDRLSAKGAGVTGLD
jgi:hypothetical protein